MSNLKHAMSGVHVFPGSAEAFNRGGGKINHGLVAYFLSYTCAKNCQNQLMDVNVIACQVSVIFPETQRRLFYRKLLCYMF